VIMRSMDDKRLVTHRDYEPIRGAGFGPLRRVRIIACRSGLKSALRKGRFMESTVRGPRPVCESSN